MKRFTTSLAVLLAAAFLLGSCILDPKKEPPNDDKKNTINYTPLKDKDDVLINLELAYNERNYDQYVRLLNEKFIFSYVIDFNSGQTEQWGIGKEVTIAQHMLNPGYQGKNPISTIDLSLSYRAGDLTWEETSPSPDCQCPNEKWYQKSVNYDLTVHTTTQKTILAIDLQALFVIRRSFVAGENDTIWQVVQWYDLGQQ